MQYSSKFKFFPRRYSHFLLALSHCYTLLECACDPRLCRSLEPPDLACSHLGLCNRVTYAGWHQSHSAPELLRHGLLQMQRAVLFLLARSISRCNPMQVDNPNSRTNFNQASCTPYSLFSFFPQRPGFSKAKNSRVASAVEPTRLLYVSIR
jgi:hypothetical protein